MHGLARLKSVNKEGSIGGRTVVLEEKGPEKDGDKQGESVEDEDEDGGC